jgi:glucose-1-phosphate adenylyltransferase
MDASQMDRFHLEKGSDFSISSIVIKAEDACRFGILEVDEHKRIIGFEEKPKQPKEIPGNPGYCLTSMGNYIINIPLLMEILQEDAKTEGSTHDFAKDVIPSMLKKGLRMLAYDFADNKVPESITFTGGMWARSDLTGKPTWIWLHQTRTEFTMNCGP